MNIAGNRLVSSRDQSMVLEIKRQEIKERYYRLFCAYSGKELNILLTYSSYIETDFFIYKRMTNVFKDVITVIMYLLMEMYMEGTPTRS